MTNSSINFENLFMRVVANSSAVSNPKPLSRKSPPIARRDRQTTTIKPKVKPALTSTWRSRPVPLWCLRLRSWQRRVGIATSILLAGTLVTYSSTVYLQQQWSQKFRKLENLQRQERQLTTTNEMLKNQLATEAERSSTALTSPNPADAIILPAAKKSSTVVKPEVPPKIDIPSGY